MVTRIAHACGDCAGAEQMTFGESETGEGKRGIRMEKKKIAGWNNLNGISEDDKTCGLNDMNCLDGEDDKTCGLNDMNCLADEDDKTCALNDMNCLGDGK